MNPPEKSWQKLLAAARRAPPAGEESAPFGFSTRVAALAFERAPQASAYARFSLRAAAVAGLLAVAAVAANYSAIMGAFDDDTPAAATDDPIAEVVDLGS